MKDTQIYSTSIPKYLQLLFILRNEIVSGELQPGDKLPTTEELANIYGLSYGTVRKAIAQLEAEKLIKTEHGIGSFVRQGHPNTIPIHFADHLGASGTTRNLSYEVLAQEVLPAPANVADRLHLVPGTPVIYVARLQKVDDRVIAYTRRYLPESIYPSLVHEDLTKGSVHELLIGRSEMPLLRAEIEVEAHMMTPEEAELMQAPESGPVIVVKRTTYSAPAVPAVLFEGLFLDEYHMAVQVTRRATISDRVGVGGA